MSTTVSKQRKPRPKSTPGWPARLVAFRAAMGTAGKPITQVRAAALVGVSAAAWIAWENSQRTPSGPAAALLHAKYPKHF
jgi:DNA-binding transcriptional regulator YiaG